MRVFKLVLAFFILTSGLFSQETKKMNFCFIGAWDRAKPLLESAARPQNINVVFNNNAEFIKAKDNDRYDIVFVLNLELDNITDLVNKLKELRDKKHDIQIVSLSPRPTQNNLENANLLKKDPQIEAYWRASGLPNMRRMLQYIKIKYFKETGEIEPPVVMPDYGYYHPNSKEIMDFEALKKATNWDTKKPNIALLMQQSFLITEDTKVINAEIKALEKKGFNVAGIFGDSPARIYKMIDEVNPNLIVEDRHGSIWKNEGEDSKLEKLNVPYLRPISMLAQTIEGWLADPQGLQPRDISVFLSLQEHRGTIESFVIGGLKENIMGFKLHEEIPERIEHFAERAYRWYQMKAKKNAEKKLAIVYYNKTLGKDDLMRGSPTGGFMDGPESLMRFLPMLKAEGYHIDPMPQTVEALIEMAKKRARNVGPWAQGELEEMANQENSVLVSVKQYSEWFYKKLNAENQKKVIDNFGNIPGKMMVVNRNGEDFIVLPIIKLGNILLAAQPARGELNDERLIHSRDVPPPHNYLAFYWWLEEVNQTDAIIHWGTHGTLELLPGKEVGISSNDWGEICLGNMLNFTPWIMDNLGEATISRRRAYSVLVDHLPPPVVNAGLTDELQLIHDNIDKFKGLEEGVLKEKFREEITKDSIKHRFSQTVYPTDNELAASRGPFYFQLSIAPPRNNDWLPKLLHP